ncbi:hypothetical protein [Aurantiacibacter suaedae]|uniref:hypothetical protein n=1 Tax=Aurantiacibacter suaedae TaxID=2545755 RepID=UPI0010F8777F|nr:hypothetical protein [Aurantiacibacter suaedae]
MVMAIMVRRGNARFRDYARLPMQWGLHGQVNWTAPRALALSFIPVLAGVVLTSAFVASLAASPREGQEDAALPVFLILGGMFVGIFALHLRLIAWSLRRNGP